MPDTELTPLDGQVSMGQGQVQDTSPESQGQEVSTPSDDGQGYFYSYTDPVKNEVKNFRNPDELHHYVGNLNKSYGELRKKFTQSTQEYADQRRAYETDRAELARSRAEFDRKRSEYEKFDKFLKNNPHVYRELKQKVDRGPSGGDINELIEQRVKEIYGSEIDEFKAHRARTEAEKARDHAFAELQKKYPGVNKEAILDRFNKLSSGNLTDVYELLHLSSGAGNAAQAQEIKQGGGILPSSTGSPGSGQAPIYKDIDAWVAANQNAM